MVGEKKKDSGEIKKILFAFNFTNVNFTFDFEYIYF